MTTTPRRWRARAVLLVALACATLALAADSAPAPAQPHTGQPAHVVQSSAEQELADRYAPIVYLKDQDGACDTEGEAFAPVSVDAVLGNPRVVLRASASDVDISAPSARDLFGKAAGWYLDLPGNPEDPGCTYERDFKEIEPRLEHVAYAHVVAEAGKPGIVLQYWFFYYFNDWNNRHEGDWEMIQLTFDAASVEQALTLAPDHTAYSQHSGAEYAAWDSSKLRREGDHPVVYVAAGSHSNEYAPKKYLGRAEQHRGFGCDDATAPSTRLALETRLIPDTISGPDDPYAWIAYDGSWGQRARGEFDGPTGPNTTTQWTRPVTWEDTRLRRSNVAVPSGRVAGINPSDAFCGVVSAVSRRLLPITQSSPWLLPLAGAVLAAGAFETTRRTQFSLVAEPLRRRRRFGQILRTAFHLYRTNLLLMLAIALAFIPASMISSALQSYVFHRQLIAALFAVAAVPRVLEIVVGIALGGAVFGVAYIVVIAGVIAAVREIEGGGSVSPAGAYRIVAHHARDLVLARLRAIAIVTALALTVVGIPWAVRRAVRWLFIEEAVILDGADRHDALAASARAVRGSWWRAGGITASLVAAGAVASLVVAAPLLLLFRTVPLDTVNLIASAAYIAFSPYVALCLVLLYFDVQAKSGEARAAAQPGDAERGAG